MKCYNHPEVDAVGVCAVCKRPVCRECQVIMEHKRFCKEHAEKRLVREERAEAFHTRGLAITIASIVAVLNGLAGIVVGFLLIIIGLLGPSAQQSAIVASTIGAFMNYFSAVTLYPYSQTLAVGFVAFLAGSIGLVAAYFLWRQSKKAAILSIVLAITGEILVGTYLELAALAGVFVFVWVSTSAARIVLILLGWKHLR